VVGSSTIVLGGRLVPYVVKRSQRARYARIEIRRETGLVVVVPKRYRLEEVASLLRDKSAWILRKVDDLSNVGPCSVGRRLESGAAVPYLGGSLELVVRRDGRQRGAVRLERGRLVFTVGDSDGDLHAALEGWYRQQARRVIGEKAEAASTRLGVAYRRLVIRGQRSRWASCSHKGTLSFNWKLMRAPEPVIDYVVVHEVAHLKEMNHSKRFWGLVAEHCPGWREHRKWLKEHEGHLAG
jgi:predicted metal-dependent hydrolase